MSEADGYIRFRCKNCFKRLKVKADIAGGDAIPCPFCGNTVVVPFGEAAQADLEEGPGTAPEPPSRPLPTGHRFGGGKKSKGGGRPLRMRAAAEGPGWRPLIAKRERIKDLDDLHKSLMRIMEESLAQSHAVLLDEKMKVEDRISKLQEIGKKRELSLKKKVIQYRENVRRRLKDMLADPQKMGPTGMKEISELKADAESVDLYTSFVLNMSLLPDKEEEGQ